MDDQILFWAKVAAIGQVAGAGATAAAVIVSLWVVLSERAARIKATAGLRLIIAGDGSPAEDVIAIEVINIGQRPVRVSSIGWRSGWLQRHGPEWARRKYAMQTSSRRRDSHDPPFALEPGEKRTMLIDVRSFQGEAMLRLNHDLFGRMLPFVGLKPMMIRCSVSVIGAKTSYFKVEKSLAQFLMTGVTSGATDKLNAARKKLVEAQSAPER